MIYMNTFFYTIWIVAFLMLETNAAPFFKGIKSLLLGSHTRTDTPHSSKFSWDSIRNMGIRKASVPDKLSLAIRKDVPLTQLEKLVDPSTINGRELNPLSEAIKRGNTDIVGFLISKEANTLHGYEEGRDLDPNLPSELLFTYNRNNLPVIKKMMAAYVPKLLKQHPEYSKTILPVIKTHYFEHVQYHQLRDAMYFLISRDMKQLDIAITFLKKLVGFYNGNESFELGLITPLLKKLNADASIQDKASFASLENRSLYERLFALYRLLKTRPEYFLPIIDRIAEERKRDDAFRRFVFQEVTFVLFDKSDSLATTREEKEYYKSVKEIAREHSQELISKFDVDNDAFWNALILQQDLQTRLDNFGKTFTDSPKLTPILEEPSSSKFDYQRSLGIQSDGQSSSTQSSPGSVSVKYDHIPSYENSPSTSGSYSKSEVPFQQGFYENPRGAIETNYEPIEDADRMLKSPYKILHLKNKPYRILHPKTPFIMNGKPMKVENNHPDGHSSESSPSFSTSSSIKYEHLPSYDRQHSFDGHNNGGIFTVDGEAIPWYRTDQSISLGSVLKSNNPSHSPSEPKVSKFDDDHYLSWYI